jgi:hypothetical protein
VPSGFQFTKFSSQDSAWQGGQDGCTQGITILGDASYSWSPVPPVSTTGLSPTTHSSDLGAGSSHSFLYSSPHYSEQGGQRYWSRSSCYVSPAQRLASRVECGIFSPSHPAPFPQGKFGQKDPWLIYYVEPKARHIASAGWWGQWGWLNSDHSWGIGGEGLPI